MTFDDFKTAVTERVPGAPWRFRDYGDQGYFSALADDDDWSIELSYAPKTARWNWWNGVHHIEGATLPEVIAGVIEMARYQTDPLQAIGLMPAFQEKL
jgi:hypothetical protein